MSLDGKKIAILATNGFEQSELEVPRDRLAEAGAEVHIVTISPESVIRGWKEKDWGDEVTADYSVDEVSADDYDALVIPGGQINPDLLRADDKAVQLVRDFYQQKKVVAAVCHAPWLLIEAGVVEGRKATSYRSIKTDMINAGAKWEDSEVVNDLGLITSRHPGDLEAFSRKIIEEVKEGRHESRDAA